MKTVLIIEDDDDLREVLTHVLTDAGYNVQSASNGIDAVASLERADHLPDLVLLDLMMPVLAGSDVLRALRANANTAQLPVVVVSAITDSHRPPGAQAYVRKPFSNHELVATIRKVVDPLTKS